jgi:hypothetical protein
MTCLSRFALVLGITLAGASVANGQDPVFIERGACPGELCEYGIWLASSDVSVRESPDVSDSMVGRIQAGELVCALTGEVHAVPGEFVVKHRHGRYAPGDTIVVYTYRGVGWFLVEFSGERFEEDLGFSPWGGSPGRRCELDLECWGELRRELEFDWWIRVDNLSGVSGWVLEAKGFDTRIGRPADPELIAECDRRRRQAGALPLR